MKDKNKLRKRRTVKRRSLKSKINELKNQADKKEVKALEREVKQSKIQELITKYLLQNGTVEILLPDGMKVQFGILQEGEDGRLIKVEDYSWMIAKHEEKTIYMNSYNYGLHYSEKNGRILLDDVGVDEKGNEIKIVSIV